MTTLTVQVPDDQAPGSDKEREYDVAFTMTCGPRSCPGSEPFAAEFDIFHIWNAEGGLVKGAEFELVAAHVLDCYYAEMLTAARS